jgi:hypothetical protein
VSRIELRLLPTHPDRAVGLGFLSNMTCAFEPLLVGQGVLLAGVMADKIFFAGAKLEDFKLELVAWVTMMLSLVLVFVPRSPLLRRSQARRRPHLPLAP